MNYELLPCIISFGCHLMMLLLSAEDGEERDRNMPDYDVRGDRERR